MGQPHEDEDREKQLRRAERMKKHMAMIERRQESLNRLLAPTHPAAVVATADGTIGFTPQTTDTILRYLGYAHVPAVAATRGGLLTGPWAGRLVKGCGLVTAGYVVADVMFEADKGHHVYGHGLKEVVTNAAERTSFHMLSSVGIPYMVARGIAGAFAPSPSAASASFPAAARLRPVVVSTALVPFFSFALDRPCAVLMDRVFAAIRPTDESA